MKDKVLIIEDDKEIGDMVKDYLSLKGYNTKLARNGLEGLKLFESFEPDLAIIDIMLPVIDGLELCTKFRKSSNIPIIILSAKSDNQDKILGLGIGADDYVTKPFSPKELLARVISQLRRYKNDGLMVSSSNVIKFSDIYINKESYEVKIHGKVIDLSTKEFDILYCLAKNNNKVLTKEQIFDYVWGVDEYGDINTVTVHIRRIREKIEANPSEPVFIETIWGVGYKFKGDNNEK
ncbi:MAG: response regulator transcription factor [Firmicutes bacterium]|nr:response regulator transcription factor [Bacillota bacterium]